MKKLLLAVVVLLFSATPVLAQSYTKLTIGYLSPEESELDSTAHFYAGFGNSLQGITGVPIDAEVGIGYYSPSAGPIDVTVIPVTLTALYNLPFGTDSWSFNLGGGLGFYFWKAEVGSFRLDDGTELGFHLQGGTEFALSDQFALIGEVKWATASDGIDLGGTSVNVGLKVNF